MSRELQSEKIDQIIAALVKAQGEIGHALLDATNPHFNSKFASLESVIDVSKGPLLKNGIAVLQMPLMDENGHSLLVTTFAHTSGQWLRSYTPIILEKQSYQSLGSGISYMRRYSLAAMANIGQDDDDANRTNANKIQTKPKSSTPEGVGGEPPKSVSNTPPRPSSSNGKTWPFQYPEGLKGKVIDDMRPDQIQACEESLLKWKTGKSKGSYPVNGDWFLDYIKALPLEVSNA